jgi:hypothetical protein
MFRACAVHIYVQNHVSRWRSSHYDLCSAVPCHTCLLFSKRQYSTGCLIQGLSTFSKAGATFALCLSTRWPQCYKWGKFIESRWLFNKAAVNCRLLLVHMLLSNYRKQNQSVLGYLIHCFNLSVWGLMFSLLRFACVPPSVYQWDES